MSVGEADKKSHRVETSPYLIHYLETESNRGRYIHKKKYQSLLYNSQEGKGESKSDESLGEIWGLEFNKSIKREKLLPRHSSRNKERENRREGERNI